jgi:hypothetical protein
MIAILIKRTIYGQVCLLDCANGIYWRFYLKFVILMTLKGCPNKN